MSTRSPQLPCSGTPNSTNIFTKLTHVEPKQMLSRLLGVFMPYDAMYHHAKFVLNEDREGMEVMNEWKKARLEELNFVGIVVRLAPID